MATAPNRPIANASTTPQKVTVSPGQGSKSQPNVPRESADASPLKVSMPSMSSVKSAGFLSGLQKAAAAAEDEVEANDVTDSEVAIAILAEMGVELTPAQMKVAAEGEKKKKMSTGSKAGLAVGGLAALGGMAYGGKKLAPRVSAALKKHMGVAKK